MTTHVLIVDDNQQMRMLLSLQLKRLGLQCSEASHGQQAFEKVTQQHYPLILMDLAMPVMDGLTATSAIRQFERETNQAPAKIIAITGQGDSDICLKSGMDAYLQKPVLIKELEKTINAHLS